MPRTRSDGPLAGHRRLTDRMIRSLAPDLGRRVLHWDELQRGLGLVVHPTGRRVFKLVYRHGGRPRWYHIGDASIGIAGARKLAARILYQVAEGRDPRASARPIAAPGPSANWPIATARSGRRGATSRGSRRTISSAGTSSRAGATSVPRRSRAPTSGPRSGRSRRRSWRTRRWPPRRRSSRGRSIRRSSRSIPPAASSRTRRRVAPASCRTAKSDCSGRRSTRASSCSF